LFGADLAVILSRSERPPSAGAVGFEEEFMEFVLLVTAVVLSLATALLTAAGLLELMFRLMSKFRYARILDE